MTDGCRPRPSRRSQAPARALRRRRRLGPDPLGVPVELPERCDARDGDGACNDSRDEGVAAGRPAVLRGPTLDTFPDRGLIYLDGAELPSTRVPSVQASSTSSAPSNSRSLFRPLMEWTRTVGIAVPIRCATSGTSRSRTCRSTIAARWLGERRRSASIRPPSSGGGASASMGAGPLPSLGPELVVGQTERRPVDPCDRIPDRSRPRQSLVRTPPPSLPPRYLFVHPCRRRAFGTPRSPLRGTTRRNRAPR